MGTRIYTETTCQGCGKTQRREGTPEGSPAAWMRVLLTIYGDDGSVRQHVPAGDLCVTCGDKVLAPLGVKRKALPDEEETDVPQAQAEKDKADLFGPSASTQTQDELASSTVAVPKYQRRRKFSLPACNANPAPHLHERQLDGNIVCLVQVTAPGEQVSSTGGYGITFEHVQECALALGPHIHHIKTSENGEEVTCDASQNQRDAKEMLGTAGG